MAHLAKLTLVPANREQVILSRKRHAKEWGRGLSEQQYLARDEQFEKLEHATDGRLVTWVLVPRDDPETLNFLCSCETFRRRAWLVKPLSSCPEEVTGYAIASVFCPPEYRKRGYASRMMQILHHVLAARSLPAFPPEWGPAPARHNHAGGDAQFSVLYSDVGDFYRRCGPSIGSPGWQVQGAVNTTFQLQVNAIVPFQDSDHKADLLTEKQCVDLWDKDVQYLADTLSQLPPSRRTRFTFMPNNGIAACLIHRANYFLAHVSPLPEHWGVSLLQKEGMPPVYATWTLDTNPSLPPVLVVTRLRSTPETFPELVRTLVAAAREQGASAVEVWNLDTELANVAALLGGRTGPREDHLPAVAWYGPEAPNEVEWVFNEKFPWC